MDRAYRAIPEAVVTPVIVAVGSSGTLGGHRVGGEGRSWDVESVLEDMAVGYGGSYELILTTQAVSKILAQVAAGIASEFLVRFDSEADALMRPEVKVKRKNVEVLRTGFARLAR
jgi:hypothetical protein